MRKTRKSRTHKYASHKSVSRRYKKQRGGNNNLLDAAFLGEYTEVNKLINEGVDVNFRNGVGQTALMVASWLNRSGIVHRLIDAGADVNIQSNDGYTALMVASDRGYINIVRILLNAGANKDLVNNHGETAVSLARTKQIYNLLLNIVEQPPQPPQPPELELKNIPEGESAINTITHEPIEEGNIMVNFNGEFPYRYYKKSTFEKMPLPKKNPVTRAPIASPITYYRAHLIKP